MLQTVCGWQYSFAIQFSTNRPPQFRASRPEHHEREREATQTVGESYCEPRQQNPGPCRRSSGHIPRSGHREGLVWTCKLYIKDIVASLSSRADYTYYVEPFIDLSWLY